MKFESYLRTLPLNRVSRLITQTSLYRMYSDYPREYPPEYPRDYPRDYIPDHRRSHHGDVIPRSHGGHYREHGHGHSHGHGHHHHSGDKHRRLSHHRSSSDHRKDHDSHHNRHLAEGIIAAAGVAEAVHHHDKKKGKDVSHGFGHVARTVGAGALGAVAANELSRYHEKSSHSSGHHHRDGHRHRH